MLYIFKGVAPHSVHLTLIHGIATLRDARHLWGKDAVEPSNCSAKKPPAPNRASSPSAPPEKTGI